ncbi:unnamed protein product [Orchesella dallaii]|uniref:Uncharacterized protein n=1 Tax=Orchesella dallaii TaxID=48710 RepID=A0ABP1QTE9_9HEXA
MKPLKLMKTFVVSTVIFASFGIVLISACEDCHNTAASEDYNEIQSKEIVEYDNLEEPENKQLVVGNGIIGIGSPTIIKFSQRVRLGLLNIQRKLLSLFTKNSDITIVLILGLLTILLVVTAAVFTFMFGPFITGLVSLVIPFAVLGVVGIPILFAPSSTAPAQTGLVKVSSIMSSKLQKSFCICQSIFGIVAILTTISCWTRVAAAAQYHEPHETQGEATIKTMRSYLPSDTLTESQLSHVLTVSTVTAAASKAGTTSTVRPWPSSKFFRSVLSKSDNVVRKSRSKSARKNNRTGVQVVSSSKLTKMQASHENRSIGMYRVNKKVKDGVNHSNELDLHPISLPFYIPSDDSSPETRDINEKSIITTHLKSDTEKTHIRSKGRNEITSQRQFSKALKHEREKQTASYLEKQSDNVTFSQPTVSIVNAMTSNSKGFDHLNSPQVGFQYEIVVPPSISPPPPKPKKPTINTSIYYVPTSTMPSSSNEYSSSESTTSLSSASAVTFIKANETINTATTRPSQSHMQEKKDAEAINQNYLKAAQISQQPKPPTHPLQLGMHFDSKYNGKRSTGNKSGSLNSSISSGNNNFQNKQLPFHPNANETRRREIKPNGLWTINHNPTTAAPIITSTFLPTVKGDGEQNWSENTLPAFTIYFPTPYTWGSQPTQVSSIASFPKESDIPHENTFDSEGVQSNQSFHRIPFENHPRDGNGTKGMNANHTLTFQRRLDGNQTAILRKRNMFTVINKLSGKPSIHVERGNATLKTKHANKKITIVKGSRLPHKTKFSERTGLVKRPSSPTIDFLTGPDRSAANVERENDYFDEDDAQANLHHWIESEQGYSVKSSTELPRFTNLTWPYYVTSSGQKNTSSFQGSNIGGIGTPAPPSTALSVSSTSQRDQKIPDLNSQYEFYIPSAAADPLQKPILVTKRCNKTAAATSETWTRVPTNEPQATTEAFQAQHENSMDHISGHKSKIKQSHWGSIGVNVKAKSQKVKPFSQQLKHNQRHQHNIKVYESSTVATNIGNPKSTPSTFLPDGFNKNPVIFSTSKHQKYFLTSPSSVSIKPIVGGQTEMASFVTAKTPTNIWYKPTINHFTARVPINGTFFGNEKVINILPTTTMKPPTTRKEDVGDDSSVISNNKRKTFQGESNGSNGIFQKDYNREGPILFKVWNLVDGKLKLQNQREIPPWALQGYLIPASGTILNLKQIPQALQPLVTDAMNKEVKGSHESNGNENKPYTWRPLPILGLSSPRPTTTKPSTGAPDESFYDEEETDPFKVIPSQSTLTMGWSGEEKTNRPISINYVLWNNPASIYDQFIYLSTPSSSISTPNPIVHLSTPTPVSHFPLSPTTPEVSPINAASSVIWHRPIIIPDTPTTTIKPFTTTLSQEKLELIFQNYFQYFSTPSPISTSTTTTAIPLTNKVPNTYAAPGNSVAWNDLQKLILRLASASKNDNDKTSITLDKEKPENFELVTNVASIALIMSYLRNQYETTTTYPPTITSQQPSTTTANEIPYDMTPPHKDQLWATVYPLFQHYLNNPKFSFIPPPSSSPSPNVLPSSHLSQLSAFISSITPTPSTPIAFTEQTAPTGTGSAYTRINHYASYYPTIPESATQTPITHITITVMPNHGATTQQIPLSKLGEIGNVDFENPSDKKLKTLLLIHKLKKKKKKFKKKKDKKKDKLKKALFGAALLHKVSKPIFNVVKQPSKYWLDLKFDIDFYELIKKKLFYWLAYRYMPVFMVLAFGLIPLTLSLVPLLYKFSWMKWWSKRSKTKFVKVKVPVPYPQPFPVHVYQPPPPPPPHYGFYDHDDDRHHGHSHPGEHFHRQNFRNENNDQHEEPPFYIDAPSQYDHQFAADTTGTRAEENDKNDMKYGRPPPPLPHMQPPRANVGRYPEPLNSFNYDQKHSSSTHSDVDSNHPNKHPFPHHPPLPLPYDHEQDQEIHVHLHDEDESRYSPQLLPSALSTDSSFPYTSYNKKDLQPYPVTKTYEMGYDIGQKLAGMTNKHDMEILRILIENKKAKINKLLDMWNLAKYGAALATSTVTGTTPAYNTADKDYSTRRKRRRKRKLRQRKLRLTSDT